MKVRLPNQNNPQNLQKIARQVQEISKKMEERLEELSSRIYRATSGGDAVSATVNGAMRITSLEINPEVFSQGDAAILSDMVIAAVNEALNKAEKEKDEVSDSLSAGLPIPKGII
jgi:DNA-binding YbaB/EbfC family protein